MKQKYIVFTAVICLLDNIVHGAAEYDFSTLTPDNCDKRTWALYCMSLRMVTQNNALRAEKDATERARDQLLEDNDFLRKEIAKILAVRALSDAEKTILQLRQEIEKIQHDFIVAIGDNRFTVTSVARSALVTPQHSPSLLPAPASDSTESVSITSPGMLVAPIPAQAASTAPTTPGHTFGLLPPPYRQLSLPYRLPPSYDHATSAVAHH